MRVVLNVAAVVAVCAAIAGLIQFSKEPSVMYLALAAAALGLGLCALWLARRYGPEPVVFYVVAAYLAWRAIGALYFAVLGFMALSARPVPDPTVARMARSGLLQGGLELGLAAVIFFLARRYGAKPDRVVQPSRNEKSYAADRPEAKASGVVQPSRNENWFTVMRVVFYLIAFCTAGRALLFLVTLPVMLAMDFPDMPPIGLGLLYLLLPLGLGIYFYLLAGRCKPEPDKDVRRYIPQGGFVLLGLGLATTGFLVWMAMNYVPNESPQFAVLDPLVFFCVAAVVVTLWALGVAALVVARR